MENQPSSSRGGRWLAVLLRPKVAIPLLLLTLLLLSPFLYRGYRIAQVPYIDHPFDVEAFGTVEISDEENARVEYMAAAAAYIDFATFGDPSKNEVDVILEKGWEAASPDIRRWLDANPAAMELWRAGTEKPRFLAVQLKDVNLLALLPDYVYRVRDVVRLAPLQALRLEAEGDPVQAWTWHRANFRCSRHLGMHGVLIERLLGIAFHAIAAEAIRGWADNPAVDAIQLRRAIDEIRSDFALTARQSIALKAEYIFVYNTLRRPEVVRELDWSYGELPLGGWPTLYVTGEPERSMGVYRLTFANWLSQIDKPRHARTPRHPGKFDLFELDAAAAADPVAVDPATIESLIGSSFLAKSTLLSASSIDTALRREEARQAALVIGLAAQLYHREHSEFPAKLDDLIGGALDEIPPDPWGAKGQPMNYCLDDKGVLVWSVGKNGIDDGGAIEWENTQFPDIGIRIRPPRAVKPPAE